MLKPLLFVAFLAVLTFNAVDAQETKFYDVLGVPRDANAKQIKAAFRKLSLQYHPDKNPGNQEAAAKYLAITEAYDILGDPEKRQIYDLGGEEGLKKGNAPASPFDMFFGGGQQGGRRKGPDFRMEFEVTLEDLYNGAEKEFKVNRKVLCPTCRGTGAKGGETKKCKHCKGRGVTTQLQQLGPGFNVQMQANCEKCGGKGKIAKSACPECQGTKQKMEEKVLNAVVEKGMPNGQDIVFERASEQTPETIPGDVILQVKTVPHARFQRQNNDLHHTIHISLKEALLGFSKSVLQLDGRSLTLERKGVTHQDYVMKVTGEGMPHHNFPSEKGDLFVMFKVDFPKKFTDEQQKRIAELLP